MRRFLVGFAILAIAAPSPRLAWAGDRQIAERIVQSLQSEKSKGNLRDFNIELHVEEGAVYLSGYVANRKQEKLALAAARKAAGVQQIFNEIEVVKSDPERSTSILPVSSRSEEPKEKKATEQKVEPEAKKAEPRKKAVAEKLEPVAEKTTVPVGNALRSKSTLSRLNKSGKSALASKIARKPIENEGLASRNKLSTSVVTASASGDDSLADAKRIATEIIDKFRLEKQKGTLRKFGIDVEVDHGVVWLKGNVASSQHQHLVLDIARRVSGVKQVVNDLSISAPATFEAPSRQDDAIAKEVVQLLQQHKQSGTLRGFGIDVQVEAGSVWLSGYVANAHQRNVVLEAARHIAGVEEVVNDLTINEQETTAQQPQGHMPVQYIQGGSQTPLAFAPAHHPVNHQAAIPGTRPVPMMGSAGAGVAPARYDHPQMPGYAWPSYAAYPNYGAVTYPNQYSASSWPYIGPFYPYPQVPLGWRKVTLEWDDGWWQLDFKDRHHR